MYGASAAFFFFAFFFSLFFLFVLEARDVLRQLHLEQLRREKERKKRKKLEKRAAGDTEVVLTRAFCSIVFYSFFFSLCFGLYVNLRMRIATLFKLASARKREVP